MTTVSVSHPGNRPNFCRVQFGEVTVWFSYQTPIAVASPVTNYRTVVRQNDWSSTTGKHLSFIDGGNKADRVPGDVFQALLAEVLA